jgi:hypothetical protein
MVSVDTGAIAGEFARLRLLGLEDLRREWRRLNHTEPPRISRDLLVLALGYRLQEIAHGGLSKATRRKLQTLAKALRTTGRVGPAPSLSLKPGARLVREWGGRTHTVAVTEDGFELRAGGLIRILPRWRCHHCGVLAVTALGAVTAKKDLKNVAQQNPHKGQDCRRQERHEKACKS